MAHANIIAAPITIRTETPVPLVRVAIPVYTGGITGVGLVGLGCCVGLVPPVVVSDGGAEGTPVSVDEGGSDG